MHNQKNQYIYIYGISIFVRPVLIFIDVIKGMCCKNPYFRSTATNDVNNQYCDLPLVSDFKGTSWPLAENLGTAGIVGTSAKIYCKNQNKWYDGRWHSLISSKACVANTCILQQMLQMT